MDYRNTLISITMRRKREVAEYKHLGAMEVGNGFPVYATLNTRIDL